MGDATYQIAMANPDSQYVGIEVHKPGVGRLLHQIDQNGIEESADH